jgi:hypothetical protein
VPYINDGDGKLNNFAKEPEMYKSEPISGDQKRNYLLVGAIGCLLVLGLVVVSFQVS